jgi:outer membrane lipoprotein-sorting protein
MTMLTRRAGLGLLVAAALAPLAAAQRSPAQAALRGPPPPSGQVLTGAARTAALTRASTALNEIRRLQGQFSQIAPNGQVSTGQFYMQRPGRLRFAYDPPASLIIVADGSVLAVQDTALRSVNRAPLRTTPLYFVLKDRVNLEADARITTVVQDGEVLFVTARDRTGRAEGAITLALAGPDLELRAWDVVDATGARTRLALANLIRPDSLDSRLFRSPSPPASGLRGTRP